MKGLNMNEYQLKNSVWTVRFIEEWVEQKDGTIVVQHETLSVVGAHNLHKVCMQVHEPTIMFVGYLQ